MNVNKFLDTRNVPYQKKIMFYERKNVYEISVMRLQNLGISFYVLIVLCSSAESSVYIFIRKDCDLYAMLSTYGILNQNIFAKCSISMISRFLFSILLSRLWCSVLYRPINSRYIIYSNV